MKKKFTDFNRLFIMGLCLLSFFSCTIWTNADNENGRKNQTVSYKVSHMLQNLDDDEFTRTETSVMEGTVGQKTNAEPKSYEGFSVVEPIEQLDIAADSTVDVKIYYTRKSYELTFDAGEGEFEDGKKTVTKSFRYGQQIVPPTVTRQGYSAIWATVPSDCPAGNVTYTVTWVEGNETVYTIRHLLESLDGEWVEQIDDRGSGHGTTASATELTESDAKSYEGFSFKEVKNTDIAADGSSEVSFYYIRNTYTLTFDAGEGTFEDGKKSVTKSFRYGETVVAPTAT